MAELNPNEINALISLLDDTDEEIAKHVTSKLLSYGYLVIPLLEDRYLHETQPGVQQKIHALIDQIQQDSLHYDLQKWAEEGGKNLFEGFFLIARFRYPDLKKQEINNQIDQIKLDTWLGLSFQQSPLDKIKIINQVMYEKYKFTGNTEHYHSPDNSYINRVLETKKGNPISLAAIYSIVAQRLNIPLFGVNLPQHFILGYRDDSKLHSTGYKGNEYMDYATPGEILFYVNAFNKGAIFSKWNIDQFLKQINLAPQMVYYEPCSNVDILMRVCRNLSFAYEKLEDYYHMDGIKELQNILQPFATLL